MPPPLSSPLGDIGGGQETAPPRFRHLVMERKESMAKGFSHGTREKGRGGGAHTIASPRETHDRSWGKGPAGHEAGTLVVLGRRLPRVQKRENGCAKGGPVRVVLYLYPPPPKGDHNLREARYARALFLGPSQPPTNSPLPKRQIARGTV